MSFWKSINYPISGLSPMHDVTNYLFRELQCRLVKPDVIYTEFVSAEGLSRVPAKFSNELRYSKSQKPIVAQLFGTDPNAFSGSITTVHALGFDGMDINMGCPAPKVLKIGGGAALIGKYNQVNIILKAALNTSKTLSLPLSIKTRILPNDKENANWFSFLADYPIQAVAIHGRFLSQEHHGEVDWEKISTGSEILKKKGIIVLGNGGIKTKPDGLNICKMYGLDGYLIGQSSIGNPYVFSDGIINKERRQKIISVIMKIIEEEHANYTLKEMQQFVFLCLKGWPDASGIKKAIFRLEDIKQILDTLTGYTFV